MDSKYIKADTVLPYSSALVLTVILRCLMSLFLIGSKVMALDVA